MKLFVCFLSLVLLSPVWADISFEDKEKIIITASRFSRGEKSAPVKVSVVHKSEIEKSGARNLAELLNRKLPFYVKESPGFTGTVWIGGMKSDDTGTSMSSRILVLLNGHSAGTGIIDSIPLIAVERVEVIAGSFSASYGSGALFGVVNIITSKKSKPGISLKAEAGSFGFWGAETKIGFDFTPFQIFFAAGFESSKDYQAGSTRFSEPEKYPSKNYQNTSYQNQKIYLGASYEKNGRKLEGSFQFFKIPEAGTPNSLFNNDLNDSLSLFRIAGDISYQEHFNDNMILDILSYINYHKRDNYGLYPLYAWEFHQKVLESGLASSFQVKTSVFDFRLGGNLDFVNLQKQGAGESYQEPESSYFLTGIFSENRVSLTGFLDLWAGARYDFYQARLLDSDGVVIQTQTKTNSFDYLSFRGGISFYPGSFRLKLHAGNGFTAPSILQLTGNYSGVFGDFQGNPDLKAESAFSYQVTAGYERVHKLLFTYSYQKAFDRISMTASTNGIKTYKNIKSAVFQSIEWDGIFNLGNFFKIPNWMGEVYSKGLYYLEYKDHETGLDLKAAYIPEIKTNTGISFGYYKFFQFSIDDSWTGKMLDGASANDIGWFHLVNLSFETTVFEFFEAGDFLKYLKIFIQVRNLLDSEYEYVDGYPMPGRNFRFGFQIDYPFGQ